jgi:hypothetical protein
LEGPPRLRHFTRMSITEFPISGDRQTAVLRPETLRFTGIFSVTIEKKNRSIPSRRCRFRVCMEAKVSITLLSVTNLYKLNLEFIIFLGNLASFLYN